MAVTKWLLLAPMAGACKPFARYIQLIIAADGLKAGSRKNTLHPVLEIGVFSL
jgi:hypothetical protein